MNEQRPPSSAFGTGQPGLRPAGQPLPGQPARPLGSPAPTVQPPRSPHGVMDPRPVPDHDPHRDAIEIEEAPAAETPQISSKIRHQVMGMGSGLHKTQEYKRRTNCNGTGACRVRSFHGRLSDEGMAFMDDKINEWLDAHPDIEIKHVTTTVGMYDGKIKEQALVVNVWY